MTDPTDRWGDRIRSARQAKQWTQRKLAAELAAAGRDVTPQSVSLWERGEKTPRPPTQFALARVLDVGWHDLFGPERDGEVA